MRVAEGIVFRELQDETVILNLETGTYFGLDPIGTRIWQLCQEKRLLRSVWETLQTEYEAPAEELEADLLGFVDELSQKGLVVLG